MLVTKALSFFFLLAVVAVHAAPRFEEMTFADIKANPGQRLIVFYRSSESSSAELLRTLEKAATKIDRELRLKHFSYAKCDGDLPENRAQFEEASFAQGSWVFTTTPVAGIEKYSGDLTVDAIVRHVYFKFAPFDADDVHQYTDEFSFWDRMDARDPSKPQFVKFYEEWCAICKRLKPTFQRGATHFKKHVDFVEVECSANDESKAFCNKNSVAAFPKFMLFTGEKKYQWDDEDKSIPAMERFLEKKLGLHSEKTLGPARSGRNDEDEEDEDEDEDDDAQEQARRKRKEEKERKRKEKRERKKKRKKRKKDEASARTADDAAAGGDGSGDRLAKLESTVSKLSSLLETVAEELQSLKKADKKKTTGVEFDDEDDDEEEEEESGDGRKYKSEL